MVLDAVQVPKPRLNSILESEFKGCFPSEELKAVFSVPWRRLYTFNIDDSAEAVKGTLSGQIIHSYNAIHSKVATYEGPRILHLVHLNGYVRELEKGTLFQSLTTTAALRSLNSLGTAKLLRTILTIVRSLSERS